MQRGAPGASLNRMGTKRATQGQYLLDLGIRREALILLKTRLTDRGGDYRLWVLASSLRNGTANEQHPASLGREDVHRKKEGGC